MASCLISWDEILILFGLALRGEGDAPIAGLPCRFHDVDDGLVRRLGVRIDDDGGVGLVARGILQRINQRLYAGVGDSAIVDGIVFRGIHRDIDGFGLSGDRLTAGLRQVDLQLGIFGIAGGHHQKDQDHQQHVYHRDQINLRLIADAPALKVHFALALAFAMRNLNQFDRLLFHLYGQTIHLCAEMAVEDHARDRHDQAEGGVVKGY
jgi:hypothetical protein